MFEGMDTGQSRAENHSGAQGLRFDLLRGFPVKEISRWGLKGLAGAAVLGLAGLILGRAVLLGELFPFGPAAAAAVCAVYRRRSWPVLLGAALGLYLASDGWENVIRLISLFLVGLAVYSLPMQAAGLRFLLGSAVFAVLMVMGAAYVALTAPSNYEYIRVLFESVFGALLAVAFYNALVGLERLVRRKPVAAGELFSMVLALSCLVAAAG
ncbi:MAG: hypothetical protein FWC60_11555, partial [Firmicutes bacterium]|nr:hypothetical protein [Bacillota bacterium]